MNEANVKQQKPACSTYTMVDVFKFILAYGVVAIHTRVPIRIEYPLIIHYLIHLAVPFFFITSGFLIARRIQPTQEGQAKAYAKKSLKYLKLFLIWASIYLPCCILYYMTKSGDPWWRDAASYVKRLVTSGDLPYAWALWYLHGVFVALLLIALMKRIKFNDIIIWGIGIALLLFSALYENSEHQSWPSGVVAIMNVYDAVFKTFRNGIFWGIAFVSTGIVTARYLKTTHPLIGLVMAIIGYFMAYCNVPLSELVGAWGVFLMAKGVDEMFPFTFNSPLRKMSSIIYFIHMYFVVFLILLIAKGWTFTLFQAWLGVSLVATVVAAFVVYLMKKQHFTWLNQLF